MRALQMLVFALLTWLVSPSAAAAPINVNTADESALDTLPGIGPSKAKAIIEHREKNGPFSTLDDLDGLPETMAWRPPVGLEQDPPRHWHRLPIALITSGALVTSVVGFFMASPLGVCWPHWHWSITTLETPSRSSTP